MKKEPDPFPHYAASDRANNSDWLTLTRRLWDGKHILIIAAFISVALGVAYALLRTETYTATTVMVPQTNTASPSQLSGLASLAGINLDMSQGNELSPVVYPRIINSISFKRELMYSTFNFKEYPQPVSLYEYYSGLKPDTSMLAAKTGPLTLTKEQVEVKRILDKNIYLSIDRKDGFLTLRVTLPEAAAAAEVVLKIQEMLQRDIVKLRTEKAQADLDFIQQRYNEVKAEAERYQVNIVSGSDRFKDLVSNVPKIDNTRMQTKFNIANTVFQELAKQLEQAKIQVKRDTPVFTVIEPVAVPYEKDGRGKILIVLLFGVAGTLLGVGLLFFIQSLPKLKQRWAHGDR